MHCPVIVPIIIHKGKSGSNSVSGYDAIVPDLPGCVAVWDSHNEVISSARVAIENYIKKLFLEDQEIPPLRAIATHLNNPDFAGATCAPVGSG